MLTRQTSIEAYMNIYDLSGQRRLVYDAIKRLGQACNLDIAEYLNMPINRVTPRTNELVKQGLVEEAHRSKTPKTGKRVIFWQVSL